MSDASATPPAQPKLTTLTAEAQVILAEKRTSLAMMRTGIAVLALPLSVLSLLVATSKYYDPDKVMHFLLPLLGMCAVLAGVGVYLVGRSFMRLRRYDILLTTLKQRHSELAEFID